VLTIRPGKKETQNDRILRIAAADALLDLLVNGSNPKKSLEQRGKEQIDFLYGPGTIVDLKDGGEDVSLYNR